MSGLVRKLAGGANQIAGEVLRPTSLLGQLGAYVGAADGGVLGSAALMAQRDDRLAGNQALEDEYRRAQIAHLTSPRPVNNDTVNDYNFIRGILGDEEAKSFLRNLAAGPPIAVDVQQADGSVVRQFMPRGQFQQPQVPTAPVGKLTPIGTGGQASASGFFR